MNRKKKTLSLSKNDINKFLQDNAPTTEAEGDITVTIATENWHCKRSTAEVHLDKLVKEGKLTVISNVMLSNGRRGRIWRQIK